MFTKFKLFLVSQTKNECRYLTGELKNDTPNIFEWEGWESGKELIDTIEFLTNKKNNSIGWKITDNELSVMVLED